jgi:hypothetical protein
MLTTTVVVFGGCEWDAVLRYVHLTFFLCSLIAVFFFTSIARGELSPHSIRRLLAHVLRPTVAHTHFQVATALWMDTSPWNEQRRQRRGSSSLLLHQWTRRKNGSSGPGRCVRPIHHVGLLSKSSRADRPRPRQYRAIPALVLSLLSHTFYISRLGPTSGRARYQLIE